MLIIATIGPSTKDKNVLKSLINGGVNVLRFNFSHGKIDEFNLALKEARKIKSDIHIFQDLSGRKIRVCETLPYIIKIYNNDEVIFCGEDKYLKNKLSILDKKIIPLNVKFEELMNNSVNEISMKDNTMQFKIISKTEEGILATVINGGIVRAGKGCNIKNYNRSKMELTRKDKEDLKWGVENSVNIICQSFVEEKEDILNIKTYIKSINKVEGYSPKIWAKIESKTGIENIDSIIDEVDGILIGRGDMIPEVSLIETPIIQDKIINIALDKGKDIILGTHLLDSMKEGRYPNLPEVESIYYHLQKGVNGFLLAGETSVGKAPIKTVEFLHSIINKYNKIIMK